MPISFGEITVSNEKVCAELRATLEGKLPQAAALALRLRARALAVPSKKEHFFKWLNLAKGYQMEVDRDSARTALAYFGRYLRFHPVPIHGL